MISIKDNSQLRDFWEKGYESEDTPFDIPAPDEWIAELEKQGHIQGRVFDAGCGPGRTAFYLARLGYDVTGADISSNAVERAKRKAAAQNLAINFFQANLCDLTGCNAAFNTLIDIGCFHSLPGKESRADYARSLHRICRPGAVLYLRAFSDANGQGLHHSGLPLPSVGEENIRSAFASNGWHVRELEHRLIDLLADGKQIKPSWCRFAKIEPKQGNTM